MSIVFKCFKHISNRYSNRHDPVHRCIIITVSYQSTNNLPKLTNLSKFVIKFQKQKLFKDVSKAISAFTCATYSNGGPH